MNQRKVRIQRGLGRSVTGLAVVGSLLALLLLGALTVPVEAQAAGEYDLALRSLESRPDDIRVGQETFFSIIYENAGSGAVPDDLDLNVVLIVTANDTGELVAQCAEPVTSVAGLRPNAIQTYSFQSCDVIFRVEGVHTLRAAFLPAAQVDEAPREGAYLPLPGDADASNNGVTISADVKPFESALPDELGQLLAGLGMFFAVMAIVAVGTEVVVDTMKVSLGMKSKVKALDALAQMEKYMPGKLASLGVDPAAQARFRQLTASMRRTVTPVAEIPATIEKVKRGDLEAAVVALGKFGLERDTVQELLDGINAIEKTAFSALKEGSSDLALIFRRVEQGLVQLKGWNALTDVQKAFLNEVETRLQSSRAKLESLKLDIFPQDVDDLNDVPADAQAVVRDLMDLFSDWKILIAILTHEVKNWSTQATAEWLSEKRSELLALGKREALARFDAEITPQLGVLDDFLQLFGSGDDALVQEARRQLEQVLDQIEAETVVTTDAYLQSIENLLRGVEERRNLIASPSRKFWRRLRQSPNGHYWAVLGTGVVVWLVGSLLNLTIVGQTLLSVYDLERIVVRVGGALIDGLLVGLVIVVVMALLARLGQTIYRRTHDGNNPTKRSGPVNAFDRIEILWNWLRGDTMEPDEFGSAKKKKEKVTGLTVENVAQVIFERTDRQRDEESSRLRWLRVISLLIGLILAYILQIDAAELLDTAVPGIEATINRVLFISGDQLHAWQPWLSTERAITAGIILTGFAAAAGSSFWHDRLDQLQTAKKGVESAASALQVVEGIKQEVE